MRKSLSIFLMAAVMMMSVFSLASVANAEDVKMVGVLTKIEMAADGKSAITTLKDNDTGKSVTILVDNDLTLDKMKEKRIVEGDEIRCKYSTEGDKNIAKIFKKTAGC